MRTNFTAVARSCYRGPVPASHSERFIPCAAWLRFEFPCQSFRRALM